MNNRKKGLAQLKFGKRELKKFGAFVFISAMSLILLAGCNFSSPSIKTAQAKEEKPVLIQGAMQIEVESFLKKLKHVKVAKSGDFVFYRGTIDQYPVILAKTGKGMENAAACTAVAMEHYHPKAIINEGTAGGHDPNLRVFDIVLGKKTVNIGSFITEIKGKNEGIDPTQWRPMDLMAADGSEFNPDSAKIRYYKGDKDLLAAADAVKDQYKKGKVTEGTIGSSDVWNNEMDRIQWFHDKFGTSAEEMEGFAQAQIADEYHIPFLDIRIISNNLTNGGQYNPNTAVSCQDYVYHVVKKYISENK